jgi:NAD(P)-dependent dehydrogenase (short-subunit alcohol dehydrogenase family)
MDLKGKNYLVVGGSSGIGFSLVSQLIEHGSTVYVASRTFPEALQAIGAKQIYLDVLGEDFSALSILPDVLDGIAYCPGSINLKPFHRLTNDDFLKDFRINVLGAVGTLQAVLKNLKAASGAAVVLFSTVAVAQGMGFHASIASSKAAVEGLAKSLAAEWAASKIRVNVVAPSLTDTPLASNLLSTPEKREASDKRHALGRVGRSEEVAAAALYLLGTQSGWITGQILHIDGGLSVVR